MPKVLEQMAGLQAQYAPAMYIGLWSRLEAFQRLDLTRMLERRTVVQGTLLRATIHLVSARDYWPFALAVRDARREWFLRVQRDAASDDAMATAARQLRNHMKIESPVRAKDLGAIVGDERVNGVGLWTDLVRVPPSGTWERRRADLYADAETWLGPPPADLTVEGAITHIIRRYLNAFGPATTAEISTWAGLRPATVADALPHLSLCTFRADNGDELVDLPRAPRPEPDTPVPVRFLAVWDASLLVHARRALIIREEDRSRIFNTKTPHSLNTFLVDGQVAGTWYFADGRVHVEPFHPLPTSVERDVDDEAERLAAFHS